MMRKPVLFLASVSLAVLLASGVALAVTKDCIAGAHLCRGTDGPDRLNGSEGLDRILGLAGDDTLLGNAGNDRLRGGPGDDTMIGGVGKDGFSSIAAGTNLGDDKILGGPHSDFGFDNTGRNLFSGGGDDLFSGVGTIIGGPGADILYGSKGPPVPTTIFGGAGMDELVSIIAHDETFHAQDGEHDTIRCGAGTDVVYYDEGIDSVDGSCEQLNPQH